MKTSIPSLSAEPRVSSLELFFDLVFVFTITQLTSLVAHDPSITGLLQTTLIFGNVWWMYGGYAWLTNAVPPREPIFLPILGGIVVVAAGMKLTVVGYDQPATPSTALFLAAGVAAYAFGLVLFRWFLHSGPLSVRSRSRSWPCQAP